jgi:hypothetical protein
MVVSEKIRRKLYVFTYNSVVDVINILYELLFGWKIKS